MLVTLTAREILALLVRPKNWNALQSQRLGPYHCLSACFPFPTRSILLIPPGQQLLLGID